ncbi:PhnD/SsuA/transferrin family substrate-binding protein [Nonomuraea phyllanthi]|uniref:PhnD/SsuA/transferrin family substrate-binding protein n=1 Tax=Nonomuraea phyllanthi TaxID=2219224 RepID=A0A5C4VHR3_9ACTN|nr:ABC transporter substrate-binding protein [Nonomuraea phyllanthi]KAB8188791.1 PhnD/SsuA/transferrin family substrate-binding protein [Nonomuraea phyllanthi]QFY05994.1 PhnD/SsuA/transferrin family substrate-binding protein [Nonomuraea phyllanthi]
MLNLSHRHLTAALASVMAFPLLTACGGDGGADANSCQNAHVRMGALNSSSDAILFIADKKGYFADQGLQVESVKFDSAAKMIAPLGSGQLDIGAGAPSAGFYNAVARGIDVRIVADKAKLAGGYDFLPILVRKDLVDSGKVKEIGDLKGLKVAEPAQATATSSMVSAVLGSGNLTYDDVSHKYVAFPQQVAAFQNGSIDAAATIEPFATVAEQSGAAVRMFDSTKVYDNQQISVLLYSAKFSSERSRVAQCFMNAYAKAAKYYHDAVQNGGWKGAQGEEVASIVADKIGLAPETFGKTTPPFVSADASVNKESLERDYQFFKDQGLLESDVQPDFSKLVDMKYVEGAGAAGQSDQAGGK